jgi:hypothetical protein
VNNFDIGRLINVLALSGEAPVNARPRPGRPVRGMASAAGLLER